MELPQELGKTSITRIVSLYGKIFFRFYGFLPKMVWGAVGKQINTLLGFYSEYQIGVLVWMHFNWRGADGEDDFTARRLQNACFPLTWLFKNVNAYEAYVRNMLKIDFDKPDIVKSFLDKELGLCDNKKTP